MIRRIPSDTSVAFSLAELARTLCRIAPLVGLSFALAACEPPAAPVTPSRARVAPAAPIPPPSALDAQAAPPSAPPAVAPEPAAANPRSELARRDNAFALDLFARTRAHTGNLVLSPFSISTALTMTWAGAKGETAAQMAKVLHLEGLDKRVLEVAGALVKEYGAAGSKVTLRVANRLFGQKGYPFEPPYLAELQGAFGAPLEPLDFKAAVEPSRGHINAWVARETRDHIRDLIPSGGLDDRTRLVLTNASYFLGDWAVAFDRKASRPAPFFIGAGETRSVPTMHQETVLRFAAIDGVNVLEMPYVDRALAMTIVLPDTMDGLPAVEARLTPATLDRWIRAEQRVPADGRAARVALPRRHAFRDGDAAGVQRLAGRFLRHRPGPGLRAAPLPLPHLPQCVPRDEREGH